MAGPTQSHQVVLYRMGHFLLSTGVLPIIPSSGTLQDSTSALVDVAPQSTANEPPIIPSSGTLQWRHIRLTPRTRLIILVVEAATTPHIQQRGATQIPSSGTLQGGPVQPNPIKWYICWKDLFVRVRLQQIRIPCVASALAGTFPIKWYNPTRGRRPIPFRGTFPIKWYNPIRGTHSLPWYLSHQVVQSHPRYSRPIPFSEVLMPVHC